MAQFPPTSYDFPNVSNYDGDLRELLAYVRQLSEDYAGIKELAAKMEEQYTHLITEFGELKGEVEAFYEVVDATVDEKLAAAMIPYAAEIARIDGRVDDTNAALEQLRTLVTNFYELSTTYTDGKIASLSELFFAVTSDLQEQIDNLQWELPEVYNLVRGVKTDLVTLIYDVYDACRDNAITAYEFDVYGLTAAEFDALNFTALEFDTNAKARLINGKCRNPFTGELDTICNVIADVAHHITNEEITATEFDSAELTAEEFNALNLTAYLFDFYAKQFIAA